MGFLASLQADQALSKHRFCNFNLFAHLLFFNLFVHLPPFFKPFAHLLSTICSALCIFVHFLVLQSLCTLASLWAFCTSAVLQSLCTFAGLQAFCTSAVRIFHSPISLHLYKFSCSSISFAHELLFKLFAHVLEVLSSAVLSNLFCIFVHPASSASKQVTVLITQFTSFSSHFQGLNPEQKQNQHQRQKKKKTFYYLQVLVQEEEEEEGHELCKLFFCFFFCLHEEIGLLLQRFSSSSVS